MIINKTFLSKGSGLGGGKGAKPNENEMNTDEEQLNFHDNTPGKDDRDDDIDRKGMQSSLSRGGESSTSRRSRKARKPNAGDTYEHQTSGALEKKSSLEEFEELEKLSSTPNKGEYDLVVKNKNGDTAEKRQKKPKQESVPFENITKNEGNKNFNKTINEGPGERQRLAKEKQEFRKQKEKFEGEKLTFEKQK
mmetsp:Transcript_14681/g.16963  ORF Transcript_14681/g.16963 Transcript_14681/m.16963 type:complete len:193 (-) Transcript_14681:1066-1644(-)